jgi:hypothetical protein
MSIEELPRIWAVSVRRLWTGVCLILDAVTPQGVDNNEYTPRLLSADLCLVKRA